MDVQLWSSVSSLHEWHESQHLKLSATKHLFCCVFTFQCHQSSEKNATSIWMMKTCVRVCLQAMSPCKSAAAHWAPAGVTTVRFTLVLSMAQVRFLAWKWWYDIEYQLHKNPTWKWYYELNPISGNCKGRIRCILKRCYYVVAYFRLLHLFT